MIEAIQDIYYSTSDMPRALNFYQDLLGLSPTIKTDYWSAFELSGIRIGLHWTGGPAVPHIPRDSHGAHGGGTLTLRVKDLDVVAKDLKDRDVKLLSEITRNPWGNLLTIEDPDGNVLKLMQRVDS